MKRSAFRKQEGEDEAHAPIGGARGGLSIPGSHQADAHGLAAGKRQGGEDSAGERFGIREVWHELHSGGIGSCVDGTMIGKLAFRGDRHALRLRVLVFPLGSNVSQMRSETACPDA